MGLDQLNRTFCCVVIHLGTLTFSNHKNAILLNVHRFLF